MHAHKVLFAVENVSSTGVHNKIEKHLLFSDVKVSFLRYAKANLKENFYAVMN